MSDRVSRVGSVDQRGSSSHVLTALIKFKLTQTVMGKKWVCSIQNVVKTFPMLPAHRMD